MHLLQTFSYLYVFLIGLALGSFYTALANRILYYFYGPERKGLKKGIWKTILLKPSFCFSCKLKITPSSLLPLWGYIMNKGTCQYCKKPIGIGNLLGELYMGLLGVCLYAQGYTWSMILFTLLFSGHLYISHYTDSRYFFLDPENTVFLFLWGIAFLISRYGLQLENVQNHLLAFTGTLVIFGLLFLASRLGRGLGLGDVILSSVVALFLGIPWALVTFQIGAATSILYIILIQKNLRSPAPLGSCIALSVLLVIPLSNFISPPFS